MKTYTITKVQLDTILAACQPVPLIMLQCGTPSSPQENANAAWKRLGDELGFDHLTVQPVAGQPQTVFTAEQLEVAP